MNAQERFAAISEQPFRSVASYSQTVRGTFSSIANIFQHREMLNLLVRRDLKSRYKDSALGFVWTLIRPLTQLLIYYIVIGKFLRAAEGIPDFAVYVFTGLTAYSLFSETVSGATASIVGNSGLIKKVYLPREVFPLASVGAALFNFMIQIGILLVASIFFGVFPASVEILYAIPSLLVLLVYGTAIGLLLSAVNVYLRDVAYLLEVVLLVMLWASPILYSWSMAKSVLGESIALQIYTNNPVTLAVLGFQRAFWISGHESAEYPDQLLLRLGVAFVIGAGLLIASQRVFTRLQGNFAQEL
ncbi:MAG: ABC transporter permease [Rhodoglobus sp.]